MAGAGVSWSNPIRSSERILAVAVKLLDEGVDDGATPIGLLAADEYSHSSRLFGSYPESIPHGSDNKQAGNC